MNFRNWFVSIMVIGWLWCFGKTANAADPQVRDTAAVEEARARMEKGQALFSEGKFAEAGTEFEEAYRLHTYGAFLYNAALSFEKAKDRQKAIFNYERFLASDPNAPDSQEIKATVNRLTGELNSVTPPEPKPDGTTEPPPQPATVETTATMRSLVIVGSEPQGAPISIFERLVPSAPKFLPDGDNPGWRRVVAGLRTPQDLSLAVGHYHVVIDAFKDFHRSDHEIDVAPGNVYNFHANLSQGEFLAQVRITSPVRGARVYIDDPPPHKNAAWGKTPISVLLNSGEHQLWVESTGYVSLHKKFQVNHGESVEIRAPLDRLDYGYLRVDGNAEEVEVEVDGKLYGIYQPGGAPLKIKLPAGPHEIVIDASGKKKYKGKVEIPRGQEVSVHATLIDTRPLGKSVIAALAAGGAAAGGYFLGQKADSLPDSDGDKENFKTASTVGYAGAGVLGALSIFFFIYDPNPDSLLKIDKEREFQDDTKKSASTWRAMPMVLSDFVGASFGGRF